MSDDPMTFDDEGTLIEAAQPAPLDGLDAAWAAVEAALPEGHSIRLIQRTYDEKWEVYSGIPDPPPSDVDYGYGVGQGLGGWKGDYYGSGATLPDALRDLAAALRAEGETP